jgi:ATPase subunit of ABC transporter with duplicated ATPase domains
VIEAEAHMKRRAEADETVGKLAKERDDLTKVITTIDARKAEILGAAKLPVDGLSIDDEGITLNSVPFAQASGAERLRVALGLAIAASPELGDVWIRDGALLDEESLELVAKHAAAAKKRVWVERVGTKDPGAIVIHDGEVVS